MDFFDFIRDVSNDQELAQDFVNRVNGVDPNDEASANVLHAFFNGGNVRRRNYHGVRPGDCGKIIALKAIYGNLALERDPGTGLVRPMY